MNYIGNAPAPSGVILVGDSSPVGMIAYFHSAPPGWVQANGATLAKASYPDLWAYAQGFLTANQTTFPGLYRDVDASNFALPNLSAMFIRGAGTWDANHVAGALGSRQDDTNLAHTHTALDGSGFQTTLGGPSYGSSVAGSSSSATTSSSGATEGKPINVALLPCVKALRTTLVAVQAEAGAYAPGTLAGFGMANNATDATNDIDVAAGRCRATGDLGNIVLTGALTKQLDAVWAPGSNAGMRASGAAIADGTYHVFAIKRPDTGVVDVAADTSVVGANIAANTNAAYTLMRRIGSILREAGVIAGFVQQGDYFRRKAMALSVSVTNPGTAALIGTLHVPVGINVLAQVHGWSQAGGVATEMLISDLAANDELPNTTTIIGNVGTANINSSVIGQLLIRTNTLAQVRHRNYGSDASVIPKIMTVGWFDRRGRDDV